MRSAVSKKEAALFLFSNKVLGKNDLTEIGGLMIVRLFCFYRIPGCIMRLHGRITAFIEVRLEPTMATTP